MRDEKRTRRICVNLGGSEKVVRSNNALISAVIVFSTFVSALHATTSNIEHVHRASSTALVLTTPPFLANFFASTFNVDVEDNYIFE